MNTLKLTTSTPGFMGSVNENGMRYNPSKEECDFNQDNTENLRFSKAYIHGEAETKAGYDIPVFFGGDLAQLGEPIEKQSIQLFLGEEILELKAVIYNDNDYYLLVLDTPEELEKVKD